VWRSGCEHELWVGLGVSVSTLPSCRDGMIVDGGTGYGARGHTASAPSLFFQLMHRGNRVAIRLATRSEVSAARCSGVAQLAFLLMPSSSWPASMRNSWKRYRRSVVVRKDFRGELGRRRGQVGMGWGVGYLRRSRAGRAGRRDEERCCHYRRNRGFAGSGGCS